jgi:pimeloyl-ACP methyl ester carboxylesterase
VHLWTVDTGGDGTPVVFLHAKTGTSESWEPQLGYFAARGYRAIAFDRRGWGRSVPVDDGAPQPGTAADDLEALVAALGIGAFHLVSVAAGAFAALDYAAWRPERLRSLVAAATISTFDEPEIADFSRRIRIEALREPDQVANFEVSAGYRGSNPAGTRRWLDIEAAASSQGAPGQPLRSPNRYPKFEQIETPVLALAGSADLIAPAAFMRLWAAHVPNVEFDVLAEAGHSIAWEQPEAFNDRVERFIEKFN